MRRHFLLIPLLAASLLLQGCVLFDMHRASEERHFNVAHVEGSSLMISSRNGGIEVIADPALDEVLIDAHITCAGATPEEARRRLDETMMVIERDTSRMLTIRPEFPEPRKGNDGARITVRLPDAYGAELTTGNGRVIARGMAGTLIIGTSNGRVTVEDHDGEAKIRTSNGRIEVREHGGPIDARSSNGRIIVALKPDVVGPIHLHSSNGSLRAEVGFAFTGRVEFDTSNGRVHVRGSDERIVRERIHGSDGFAVIGSQDGSESRMDTSNGGIELIVHD